MRRLSEERVFRMTKKKIEDFLTNTEKEELLENYKCLREARTKSEANYFGEAVDHLLNKVKNELLKKLEYMMKTQQLFNQKEKHCFSKLTKTVLFITVFFTLLSHLFHKYK